VAVEYRVIRVF